MQRNGSDSFEILEPSSEKPASVFFQTTNAVFFLKLLGNSELQDFLQGPDAGLKTRIIKLLREFTDMLHLTLDF